MSNELPRKAAIEYIYRHKKGTLESLKNHIGAKNLEALQLTGLIKRGQEVSGTNSWACTTKAINLVEAVNPKNQYSVIERIQNFINSFLINKTLKTPSL